MALGQAVGWLATGLGTAMVLYGLRSTMRRMANPNTLSIAAQPKKKWPVELIGVKYEVNVPKKALAMALMMRVKQAGNDPELVSASFDVLITKMFGKEGAPAIHARLEDEDDDLDIDHLMELMGALLEVSAGDPTT